MVVDELKGYYEYAVDSQEYDYGDYFEQIVYPARVVNAASNKHLIEGMYGYYSDQNYERPKNKAVKVVKETERKLRRLSAADPKAFDDIREAVNHGYVWKFQLEVPWHPGVAYDKERIFTVPYQHQTAVLYSGQAKHVFFSKKGKKDLVGHYDPPRNPHSILEQKKLRGGNQWVDDTGKNQDGIKETGVWLGLIDKAKEFPRFDEGDSDDYKHVYNGSVVFEVEIPTEKLVLMSQGAEHRKIYGIEDFGFDRGDSPIKYCRQLDRNNEFLIPEGGLQIKNIVGVWDKGKYDYPHFISFPKFANLMRKNFSKRMPNENKNLDINPSKRNQKLEKKARGILEEHDALKKLELMSYEGEHPHGKINTKHSSLISSIESKFEDTLYVIEDYPEVQENLGHKAPAGAVQTLGSLLNYLQKWNKLYLEAINYRNMQSKWLSLDKLIKNPRTAEKMFSVPQDSGEIRTEVVRESVKNQYSGQEIESFLNKRLNSYLGKIEAVAVNEKMLEKIVFGYIVQRNEVAKFGKEQFRSEVEKVEKTTDFTFLTPK